MLQLVEDVVLVDVEAVRTKRKTKDLVTIIIKVIYNSVYGSDKNFSDCGEFGYIGCMW